MSFSYGANTPLLLILHKYRSVKKSPKHICAKIFDSNIALMEVTDIGDLIRTNSNFECKMDTFS